MSDIGNFMKLLLEGIETWKKLEESINAGHNKKQNKKLLKACKKALKTGKDSDLDAVRKYMFIINW